MCNIVGSKQASYQAGTMTTTLHTGSHIQQQTQRTQLQYHNHARLPIVNANGRRAFYDVSDAMQQTGNRGRAFDTIVLEISAETGDFKRYVVFRQHVPIPKPTLPMATSISSAAAAAALYAISHPEVTEVTEVTDRIRVDATIIIYDTDTEKFYSDGAYHKHTFCPSADGFVSVSDEHIANEKFKFYKQRV